MQLIDHSSRPISAREIRFFFYHAMYYFLDHHAIYKSCDVWWCLLTFQQLANRLKMAKLSVVAVISLYSIVLASCEPVKFGDCGKWSVRYSYPVFDFMKSELFYLLLVLPITKIVLNGLIQVGFDWSLAFLAIFVLVFQKETWPKAI